MTLLLILGGVAVAQDIPRTGAVPSQTTLRARLADHLAQPRFAAAAWGVKIVSLDTGQTLFEHNAHKLLKPASNAKLYTGALALDRLGPDYRIRTTLYARSRPDAAGVLAGDLVVYGRGDPSFAARFNEGDYAKSLEPLAQALVAAGVKRITGDLVGDESFFRGPPFGFGWAWDDLQYYYGAEVSALTVDDNVVDLFISPGQRLGEPCRLVGGPDTPFLEYINRTSTVATGQRRRIHIYRPVGENVVYVTGQLSLGATNHVGAVSVHEPARWFLARLQEALARQGITVEGRLRVDNWQDRLPQPPDYSQWMEVAFADSRPLAELVGKMMKPSQNLYAQLLLLHVGARSARSTNELLTTEDAGLEELGAFLDEVRVPKSEVLLEEGSGLSRGALLTPNATVTLLQSMSRHRLAQAFRDTLPVAGVDGTLRRRMQGTAAAGNARAKTGTLRYVNTLSGYVTTAAQERLAFSLMLNNYKQPDGEPSARADLDFMVVLLAELATRSG